MICPLLIGRAAPVALLRTLIQQAGGGQRQAVLIALNKPGFTSRAQIAA